MPSRDAGATTIRSTLAAAVVAAAWLAAGAAPGSAAALPPLPAGCGGGGAATNTVLTQNTPLPIPDNSGPVASTITVSGLSGSITDVDAVTGLTHTYAADIDMTLTSPAGTIVTLTTDNGAGTDNVFNGTLWDDQADSGSPIPYTGNPDLATDHVYTNLVAATQLVPEEALGAFRGENPNGTWTISISDDAAGDVGTLNSWELHLQTRSKTLGTAQFARGSSPALAIPDNDPAGATSTIAVAGARRYATRVSLSTDITHTFSADLDMTLTSPAGTVVTLTTDNGAGNDDVFAGTAWFDAANPAGALPYATNDGLVTDRLYANGVVATELVPEEALAAFGGENPNGTWTLTMVDDVVTDTGTLNAWSLAVRAACPDAGFRVGDASVKEGNSGTHLVRIPVRLSKASAEVVRVHYATKSRSARAGTDYRRKTGTLVFQPGKRKRFITVRIMGDLRREATEKFVVRLSHPVAARIFRATGTVKLRNDDL